MTNIAKMPRPCRVEECTGLTAVPGTARELCSVHYQRWMKRGSVELPPRPPAWSKGLTVADPRIAARAARFSLARRGQPSWNKGLTKADPRVARNDAHRRAARTYENKGGRSAAIRRYYRTENGRAVSFAGASRRRARIAGSGGSHTAQEWREKIALLGGCCIYCGRDDMPLTRDHKVPLARGGTDDIANVVPACLPCNLRKGTRTAHEFLSRVA